MNIIDLHVGKEVWTIGATPGGYRGVISGTIAEIGNDHVWLIISWRTTKFHSRLKTELYETRAEAQADFDYQDSYCAMRFQHSVKKH